MSRILPSREEEAAMWGRLERQRSAREAARRTVTPQGAAAIGAMNRAHPGLATGTKVSLAQAGVAPDDPIMQTVVQADQRVKRKKGFGFHSIGDAVTAGLHNTIGKGLEVAGSVLSPVGDLASSVARPVVRTGLMALSAPFEEAGGLLRNIASAGPGRSGEVTAGVGGGAAAGAGIGGGIGALFGGIGAVPGAAIGGLIGGAVGGVAGMIAPEVEGTPQWAPQSQLGMAAVNLAQGEKVEAGSGWFANAGTGLGQEQRERAIKAAAVKNKKGEIIGGWTIGRSVADVVAEPGTTPYNLLSGLIDASAAIKLDPASAALKGRNLSVTKHGRALRALKKDGMIDGARRTILPEKVIDLVDHSEFGADLKAVVAAESNPYRIGRLFNGQLDHNPKALSDLARTTTDEEAAALLKPLLGADVATVPRTQLRKARIPRLKADESALRSEDIALRGRQRVEIGHRRVEWDDPAESIKAVDAFQAMAKVPAAERLANNGAFIDALADPAIAGRLPALKAVAGSVESALVARGTGPAEARRLSQLFAGSVEDARQYTAGTIVDDALLPGMVINGDGVGLKSPFLEQEFLSHGVTLPDPRELSDAARWNRTLNHPLVKGTTATVDKALGVWRAAAILRPAYILRVGGEAQARIAATGNTGLFNHPAEFIMRLVAEGKGNKMPDLTGSPLMDDEIIRGGLSRAKGSELGKVPGVTLRDRARIKPVDGPDLFKGGWRDHELSRLHTDPLGRQLARLRRTGNSAALDDEIPELAHVLEPVSVAAKPRPLAHLADEEHYARNLGDYTDVLYRETSARDLGASLAAGSEGAFKKTYLANTKNLAIGQGDNHGLMVEFDAPGISGQLNRAKPGWKPVYESGEAEFVAGATGAQLQSNLRRVTITDPDVDPSDVEFMLGRRFQRVDNPDGTVSFVRDDLLAKTPPVDDAVRTAVLDTTGRGPNYQSVDELKQSFWDGPLSRLRHDLQKMDEETVALASRADSDRYVDQINVWIDDFTRNDDRLLDYVQHGPKGDRGDKAFAAMDELLERGEHPAMVVGDRTLRSGGDQKGHFDRFVDTMFDWIATKPDNRFAREPVLREDYWRAVERMMPAMSPEDQAWALKLATDAKNTKVAAALKERQKVPFDGELLPKDQVHLVASHEAADNTKKLLYEMSTKAKWADATRLIFPFAEPWKEALTIWAKILSENPAAVRRLDQTIQGARGAGFFQKDPQTGEEMFVYPGSAFISKLVVGAPIPIRGSAAGLNLFGSNPVMPGMGPLVQVAANWLVPDKPDYDWIKNTISPYGPTDTSEGFVESFLPPWVQKMRQALTSGESDRLFNNTVYDMGRYLVSTGKYSIDTPEAQEETSAAAVSMAKRMYLLRTGASFISPSAPTPQMVAEDKDGRVVTQFALMEEYRALQKDPGEKTKVGAHEIEGVGYENAVAEFLDRYGEDALMMMQPKTKGGAAPLDDTMDWIRDNPGLAKRYDEVYQYFAPHSGEYSQTAYERELATGERKPLTPKEAMEAANSRVASMLMRAARGKTGTKTSDGERKWLSDVQNALISEYPGYNPKSFDAGRVPAAIRQLEQALDEPKMSKTKNGEAIAKYLQARSRATEVAKAAGLSGFERAKKARGVRDWLRSIAGAITEETPEFATVWDQLLSHELVSDLEETTTA